MKNIILSLFLAIAFASSPAMAQDTQVPHVKIRLIPERNTIQSGEGIWVLIEETIDDGWHTYWTNPGDSGAAPRIKWTLPNGFTTSDIEWPAPHKINVEGLTSYGYEKTATFSQSILSPEKNMPKGPITAKVDFEILVCKDICIPEKSSQTLTLNDPAAAAEDHSDDVDAAFNARPVKNEWHGTYKLDDADFIADIKGTADSIPNLDVATLALIPVEWGVVQNAAPVKAKVVTNDGISALEIRQAHDDRDLKPLGPLTVLVTYKMISGKDVAQQLVLKPDTTQAAAPDVKKNSEVSQISLIEAIGLALLGGLILNLMPCVFPVLSIKALSLIKLREKGWGTSAFSGIAYTIGVLLSFAVIGSLLLGVKVAGGDIGWGFQLQNPVIVLALADLLFIIALNLSGLFDINGSFIGVGSKFASRNGFAGSFFTGVLATLVATPCTAPFMAGALGFALVQPPVIAMAVFLALGLGLSLPYLALSLIPALAAILPRPGLWMVKFREFLAFPVYASAAWLIWVLSMQSGTQGLLWSLTGMVSIAFALWLLAHRPRQKTRRVIIIALALLSLLFAAMPFMDQTLLQKQSSSNHPAADTYTPEKLDTLIKGDKPVFVYMTASWCITCKVNERIAINTDATQNLFREKSVAVLEGDWTSMNPDITEFLKSYGRSGVPLYIYYGPRDKDGHRPNPIVLPQILTPGLMRQTLGENS